MAFFNFPDNNELANDEDFQNHITKCYNGSYHINKLIVAPKYLKETQPNTTLDGYLFKIKSFSIDLTNLVKNLHNNNIPQFAHFSVRLLFYDTNSKSFFGHAWTGPFVEYKFHSKLLANVTYNQEVTFLTPDINNEETVLLLAEYIYRYGDVIVACGWSTIPVFNSQHKNAVYGHSAPSSFASSIFPGSVRVLPFIGNPFEIEKTVKPLPGSSIDYQIKSHEQLTECTDSFPENAILGVNEIVPGIEETTRGLRQTKLLQRNTYTCDKITISVHQGSLLEFENEFCQSLQEFFGGKVEITERRLNIGIHNSWEYIDERVTVSLSVGTAPDSGTSGTHSTRSHRKSLSAGNIASLLGDTGVLTSKTPVTIEMPDHPSCGVIVFLEYSVTCQSSTRTVQKLIPLRFFNFKPFGPEFSKVWRQDRVEFTMKGGVSPDFPDNRLLYKDETLSSDGGINAIAVKLRMKFSEWGVGSDSAIQQQPRTVQPQRRLEDEEPELPWSAKSTGRASLRPDQLLASQQQGQTLGTTMSLTDHQRLAMMSNPVFLLSQMMMQQTGSMGGTLGSMPQQPQQQQETGPTMPEQNLTAAPLMSGPDTSLLRFLNTSAHIFNRTEYSRLYSAGFQPITDGFGEAPEIVSSPPPVVDIQKETQDTYTGNEIVLQFLAFTRGFKTKAKSLFLTFQFYRFPPFVSERLVLSDKSFSDDGRAFLLLRETPGKAVAPPGYTVRFGVDPFFLRPGEQEHFVSYLQQHILHIDVFDGDSLLLLGSCGVSLGSLLRQGRRAVQTTQVLSLVVSGISSSGCVDMGAEDLGQIHVRLANVGYRSSSQSLTTNGNVKHLVEASQRRIDQQPVTQAKIVRVHQSDKTGDLREFADGQQDNEKLRKLARLAAVKKAHQEIIQPDATLLSLNAYRADRKRHQDQLNTIDFIREKSKNNVITELLESSISSEHTLFTSFGSTEFFEFSLENPNNTQEKITIDVADKEGRLQIVTDAAFAVLLKAHFGVSSPTENDLFQSTSMPIKAVISLRAREKVLIPFRYFESAASTQPTVVPEPSTTGSSAAFRLPNPTPVQHENRIVKAYFRLESGTIINILTVNVQRQPAIVDQTMRFYHPELSYFKRSIRLPPPGEQDSNKAHQQITLLCSDPGVHCQVHQPASVCDPLDVFVKVSCGNAPSAKSFLLAVYLDALQIVPVHTLQVVIQSLQQADITCQLGQPAKRSMLLRGFTASRKLNCFSSDPSELVVAPNYPFILPQAASQDVTVVVQPKVIGKHRYQVNVIDVEFHRVLKSWLYVVNCEEPEGVRVLDVKLPLGGGRKNNQKFTFQNPRSVKTRYTCSIDRPDLLALQPMEFEIGVGESQAIHLHFAPLTTPGSTEIYFFLNGCDGKNEETVLFRLNYSDNNK